MAIPVGYQWNDYEEYLLNEGVTKKRIQKLRSLFFAVSRHIDMSEAGRAEIEQFVSDLNRDRAVKLSGEPFSATTKCDLKKFLRQYFKHLRGEDEYYPKEVSWIKTKIPKDQRPEERPIIDQEQALQLAASFLKPEFSMITLLLFDSGFRIQEMLSVKKRDLTYDTFDDEGNKCFWIKCNVSKTETRNIPVQLFTEHIQNFVNSNYYQSLNPDDKLFPISYDYYLRSLKKYSYRLFKKKLTPHALRHSSATLYAKLLGGDMIGLANRYGWTYSGSELKTYIRKSKSFHHKSAQKVYGDEVVKLRQKVSKLEEQMEALRKTVVKEVILEIAKKKI